MEKDTIIYDLENPALENPAPENPASENPALENPAPENQAPENPASENPASENPAPENPAPENPAPENPAPENSDSPTVLDSAETEIRNMISEIGADNLLQLIKDNRNAAIRQIISEVEATHDPHLPSGGSSISSCNSIFALAAMA